MLNRRSLRIKVAQRLYAFFQRKQANLELAKDEIQEKFTLNFNTPESVTKEQLDQQRTQALQLLSQAFEGSEDSTEQTESVTDEEVIDAVDDAIRHYEGQVKNDQKQLRRELIIEAEKVEDLYLLILKLLIDLKSLATGNQFKNAKKNALPKLAENTVLKALANDENLDDLVIRKKISWQGDRELVIEWYKDVLLCDQRVVDYEKVGDHDLEADREMVLHITKQLIFKNELMNNHFDRLDLNWEEDQVPIKSMVLKTLKSVFASGTDFSLEISPLSYNWEDDKAFFEDLFVKSIEMDEEYDQLVAEKSKNWDIHRLAIMDKIIMKMAVCEMINFPSIPVKVSINEYIEISKRYSTPKSKQFVNGLLDGLANKLVAEGVIKKSGRGLIDNK